MQRTYTQAPVVSVSQWRTSMRQRAADTVAAGS